MKAAGGKKRSVASYESDDDEDVFVPRCEIIPVYYILNIDQLTSSPTRDSPKKARSKDPSTPTKVPKSVQRQLIFDVAVYVSPIDCFSYLFSELTFYLF